VAEAATIAADLAVAQATTANATAKELGTKDAINKAEIATKLADIATKKAAEAINAAKWVSIKKLTANTKPKRWGDDDSSSTTATTATTAPQKLDLPWRQRQLDRINTENAKKAKEQESKDAAEEYLKKGQDQSPTNVGETAQFLFKNPHVASETDRKDATIDIITTGMILAAIWGHFFRIPGYCSENKQLRMKEYQNKYAPLVNIKVPNPKYANFYDDFMAVLTSMSQSFQDEIYKAFSNGKRQYFKTGDKFNQIRVNFYNDRDGCEFTKVPKDWLIQFLFFGLTGLIKDLQNGWLKHDINEENRLPMILLLQQLLTATKGIKESDENVRSHNLKVKNTNQDDTNYTNITYQDQSPIATPASKKTTSIANIRNSTVKFNTCPTNDLRPFSGKHRGWEKKASEKLDEMEKKMPIVANIASAPIVINSPTVVQLKKDLEERTRENADMEEALKEQLLKKLMEATMEKEYLAAQLAK
jgi:hypothetical protein